MHYTHECICIIGLKTKIIVLSRPCEALIMWELTLMSADVKICCISASRSLCSDSIWEQDAPEPDDSALQQRGRRITNDIWTFPIKISSQASLLLLKLLNCSMSWWSGWSKMITDVWKKLHFAYRTFRFLHWHHYIWPYIEISVVWGFLTVKKEKNHWCLK